MRDALSAFSSRVLAMNLYDSLKPELPMVCKLCIGGFVGLSRKFIAKVAAFLARCQTMFPSSLWQAWFGRSPDSLRSVEAVFPKAFWGAFSDTLQMVASYSCGHSSRLHQLRRSALARARLWLHGIPYSPQRSWGTEPDFE
jgi:hypothetical protein